jgi:hypothetical protein
MSGGLEACRPIRGHVHKKPLGGQPAPERRPEALLVFDHQQAHGTQPVTVDEAPQEFSVGSQAAGWKMGP